MNETTPTTAEAPAAEAPEVRTSAPTPPAGEKADPCDCPVCRVAREAEGLFPGSRVVGVVTATVRGPEPTPDAQSPTEGEADPAGCLCAECVLRRVGKVILDEMDKLKADRIARRMADAAKAA